MKYFTSIENTSYFHWQIELLIESFKHHNLQNQLYVAIADNDAPAIPTFKKNLLSHPHIYVHRNYAKSEAVPKCTNKFFSLRSVVDNGFLEPPFTVIHPDMVLLKPVEANSNSLTFHEDSDLETLRKPLLNYMQDAMYWIPLGGVMTFNNIPTGFFTKAIANLSKIVQAHGCSPGWSIEKMVWIKTIYEEVINGNMTMGCEQMEQTMLDHDLTNNFIHYKHGNPPEFSKFYYTYEPPITLILNGLDPFEAIYMNNVTSSTDFICKLIEGYRAS